MTERRTKILFLSIFLSFSQSFSLTLSSHHLIKVKWDWLKKDSSLRFPFWTEKETFVCRSNYRKNSIFETKAISNWKKKWRKKWRRWGREKWSKELLSKRCGFPTSLFWFFSKISKTNHSSSFLSFRISFHPSSSIFFILACCLSSSVFRKKIHWPLSTDEKVKNSSKILSLN